jgi:hypothetical protein
VLAFSDMAADIPSALSGGASARVIWRLALASHSGSAGVPPLASGACFSSAFPALADFDAVRGYSAMGVRFFR